MENKKGKEEEENDERKRERKMTWKRSVGGIWRKGITYLWMLKNKNLQVNKMFLINPQEREENNLHFENLVEAENIPMI